MEVERSTQQLLAEATAEDFVEIRYKLHAVPSDEGVLVRLRRFSPLLLSLD